MTSSPFPRKKTPADIVSWIKHFCDKDGTRKRGVTFLVGAGFSASAGIPTAREIVDKELKTHPLLAGKSVPPNKSPYAYYMSELPPVERTKIIREAIRKAEDPATGRLRINWAHLLLATMVDAGYVNQILTTNFDPLIIDALALINQPVRPFDLTASVGFQAGALEAGSVIYLHGQSHSLWLSNSEDELRRVCKHLNTVLQDAIRDSILIVVGYSGECDPVLDELTARFPQFRHCLYWVHYGSHEKLGDNAKALLSDYCREAFLVEGLDADSFMRELVLEGLKLKLPQIVADPLKSLAANLNRVMSFPNKEGDLPENDPVRCARELVEKARASGSSAEKTQIAATIAEPIAGQTAAEAPHKAKPEQRPEAGNLLMTQIAMASAARDIEKLNELRSLVGDAGTVEIMKLLGDGYMIIASENLKRGGFVEAKENLNVAEKLGVSKPQWLLTLWGVALADEATTKTGGEADQLFREACDKYARALAVKPDMNEALNNWGNSLSAQAKTKTGAEADRLFGEAYDKYARAIEIKPDTHEALQNWGNALLEQAKTKTGAEADRLFGGACDKYERVLDVKPDVPETFQNWGNALLEQAKTKTGDEANRLFGEACDRYARVLAVKPDTYEAIQNWGNALSELAKTKTGEEANRLFGEACDKYARALAVKPDMYEAFLNWGAALAYQVKAKSGAEADRLFSEACDKYALALSIKPEKYEVLYNWGIVLSVQAMKKTATEMDCLFSEAYDKYVRALAVKPEMPESLNNWGATLTNQAKRKSGAESDRLFDEACDKYARALEVKPDMHEALHNWGSALSAQAEMKTGAEAGRLFGEACDKHARELAIKPEKHEALTHWGTTLLAQAKMKTGAEADQLFRDAEGKYLEALKIKPDSASILYNYACLEALRKNIAAAITWLQQWASSDPSASRKKIIGDSDFDAIRHEPAFDEFIKTLPE